MYLTYQYRIKDSSTKFVLQRMGREVNYVWNYCNDIVRKRWKESRFYTDEDLLQQLTKGSSRSLDLYSQSLQHTYKELLEKLREAKKQLRFRTRRRNLYWIPFPNQAVKLHNDYCIYAGHKIRFWHHRPFPDGSVLKSGSFSEDSEGKWYINLVMDVPRQKAPRQPVRRVGIDLGQEIIVALSDGTDITRENLTKKYEQQLADAQRHHKKRRVTKIHAKIRNTRKDWAHKTTDALTKKYRFLYVGDVVFKTKSALDAGWSQTRSYLSYKAVMRRGKMYPVSEQESASTVTCSACLNRTGPSGLSGLGVREWVCPICGTVHRRDTNGAKNHLRFGRETLRPAMVKGSPVL